MPVSMNPYDPDTMEPNFWLSCMMINEDAMCKQVRGECDTNYLTEAGKTCPDEILAVLERHNVQGRPIWKPMHMQPLYRMNGFVTRQGKSDVRTFDQGIDVGADIFQRGLCLPSDNKMTAEEQEKIIQIVRSCFA